MNTAHFRPQTAKTMGKLYFFSLFDFFLNYCRLATEIQHLLKRERLKNYCTFIDWWRAATCPLTTTMLFPILSSAPTLWVNCERSFLHPSSNSNSFVLISVVCLISRPLRRFHEHFHSRKGLNDNDLLLTIHLRLDVCQLFNTSSRT